MKNQSIVELTEKEKYARKIEDAMVGQLYLGDGERYQVHGAHNQPLGKLVNQVEMKDPEARRRLREALD